MNVFCTLFDSNYLDKGLVMYKSLVDTGCNFRIYILAMDDRCKEILDSHNYHNVITICLQDFIIDVGLSSLYKNRSRAEFCWTCTSFLIDYILRQFNEPICTYIDSDLFFYYDPQCLIDEMKDSAVQIVEHRFDDTIEGRLNRSQSGTYCVEFNTFKNTKDALALLQWWKDRCFESCSIDDKKNKGVFGDQGYLEHWGHKTCVSVLKNRGGGVAPWNISQYRLDYRDDKENRITLIEKKSKLRFRIVFYHFHNITYYDKHKVNINVYGCSNIDDDLVKCIYIPYLKKLDSMKNELHDKFGFYPLLTTHPGFEKRNIKKKKTVAEFVKTIDKQSISRLYVRIIRNCRYKKDRQKNIISFEL